MQFSNETKAAEQKRVDRVENLIDQQLTDTAQKLEKAHKEKSRITKNYGSNTRANFVEADDIIDTYATIEQQKQLTLSASSNEHILQQQENSLHMLQSSPYFGRIDITEDGDPDTLYVGTSSLTDKDGDFIVYDWRAPISGIYYNGTLGDVSYQTPNGKQTAQLKRKRQFSIIDGHIKNMFDTNTTVGDEILKNALGNASSEYMKNIVETIQQEQNQIIRDTKSDVMIVQGAAGSGKTSAILQRIAFLLYHSRAELNSDQIILFSPNNLFSSYISKVLPSLGEKNMRQVTMNAFLSKRLHGLKIETLFERFERDQLGFNETAQKMRQFKESKAYLSKLTDYVKTKCQTKLCFADVMFNGQPFFSKEEILAIYQNIPKNFSVQEKYLQTKNQLIKNLKHYINTHLDDSQVLNDIDDLNESEYQQIIDEYHLENASVEQKQITIAKAVLKKKYLLVYDALYNDYFWDTFQEYYQFLKYVEPQDIDKISWQEMITVTKETVGRHKLRLDDAAPILFLRGLITRSGQNHSMQYLFIDEMQDYSLAQLAYIRQSFPNAKLTLLGDIEQNVYSNRALAQNHFQNVSELFNSKKTSIITLNQSYRSTADITNFAKQFITSGKQIRAFNRSGAKPVLIESSQANIIQATLQLAKKQQAGEQTVAILTKTRQQAQSLFNAVQDKTNFHLLTDSDLKIPNGIVILPTYLAKGLEFDVVIGFDISQTNYQNSGDAGILYTIATRAMQRLFLTYTNPRAKILDKADIKTYETKKVETH